MTRHLALTALLLGAGASPPALAQQPDVTARSLAATCTGCHGPAGVSAGGIPSIAGMDKARMVTLMREFRDGKREASVMQQHAKGYTDQQIEAIARWFAGQQ
jgi:cytochrome c553